MDATKRVLVIGLDGATLDLIKPWMKEGKLPNLTELVERGTSGELESTVPPVSIPAWISFATGKNPGKLGVYDLIKRKTGSYFVQPWNPGSLRGKTVWNILNDNGIRTGIVNVPGTYPPRKVDGCMITGMFTPSGRSNFTYPKELKSELSRVVGGYELDVDYWRYFDEDIFLREVYRVTEKREKAAEYLIKNLDTQFFMVVFTSLDRIQHVMWKHMDANHPQHDLEKAKRYSNMIKSYWERLDSAVGKLLKVFGDGGTVIVMSDHGFGPRTGTFYINDWLKQKGFLKLKKKGRKGLLVRLGQNIEKMYFLFGNTSLYRLISSLIYKFLGRELIYRIIFRYLSFERMIETIDWDQTKAFSSPHSAHFGQVYINLRGREPKGCVDLSEYEKVRNEVVEEMGKLEDPLTKEIFETEIYKPEEIYSGPYVNQAPDIVFLLNNSKCEADTSFGHNSLFLQGSFDPRCTGTHNKKGVFVFSGPDIKEGGEIKAKITDLAPTLLHLLDLPVPKDMDGRVLKEIFKEGSAPAKREVTSYEPKIQRKDVLIEMPEEDERRIEERLRSLGYLH